MYQTEVELYGMCLILMLKPRNWFQSTPCLIKKNAYDVGTDSSISTFSLEDKTELKDYEKADIQKEETNSDSEPVEPVKETETPVNDAPVQEDKTIVENQEEIKTNASDDLENSEVIDKPLDGAVASEVNEWGSINWKMV